MRNTFFIFAIEVGYLVSVCCMYFINIIAYIKLHTAIPSDLPFYITVSCALHTKHWFHSVGLFFVKFDRMNYEVQYSCHPLTPLHTSPWRSLLTGFDVLLCSACETLFFCSILPEFECFGVQCTLNLDRGRLLSKYMLHAFHHYNSLDQIAYCNTFRSSFISPFHVHCTPNIDFIAWFFFCKVW
jgi:hypothetical protein